MTDAAPTHFPTPAAFRAWLRKHHKSTASIVLRIAKTHAVHRGVTYAQALDEALCFGWIDGVRRSLDGDSFSVRFTPRKPGSIWSTVNVHHAERLIKSKRMTPAGLVAFNARTASKTGIYSFEQRPTQLTRTQLARFRARPRAWAYVRAEAPWYRRTSSYWVLCAKRPETQLKRLDTLIACSARGKRIPLLDR